MSEDIGVEVFELFRSRLRVHCGLTDDDVLPKCVEDQETYWELFKESINEVLGGVNND